VFYPHSLANNDSSTYTSYEECERIPLYEERHFLKQLLFQLQQQQKTENEALFKQTGYSNVGFSKTFLFECQRNPVTVNRGLNLLSTL
jgi:hypothetical protein